MSTAESRAARLAFLTSLAETATVRKRITRSAPIIETAVEATGLTPGLFLDENGGFEARWVIRQNPKTSTQIVNVTFGEKATIIYIYDRSNGSVEAEIRTSAEDPRLAEILTVLIESAVNSRNRSPSREQAERDREVLLPADPR